MEYQPRLYREHSGSLDLVSFKVTVLETDLFISADSDLRIQAKESILRVRKELDEYIVKRPEFKDSLEPITMDEQASPTIGKMLKYSRECGVGPMASVAGAVSEFVGEDLLKFSKQVVVENGGDIFIASKDPRKIGVHAGSSKFSEKLILDIAPEQTPCGVCTSSATVGHSLSFGKADAVVIISPSTSLADACATATCNKVKSKSDIEPAIEYVKSIKDITGVLIVIGDALGVWGSVKLH